MPHGANAMELEIADITAVCVAEPNVVQLNLRDRDEQGWTVRLPLDVLDACLRRLSGERVLELRAETPDDHARLTCPTRAWEFCRDPASPEPTFSFRTRDGRGLEVGFNLDPVTAVPTLAVTLAAG